MGEFYDYQLIDEEDDEVCLIVGDIESLDIVDESDPLVKKFYQKILNELKSILKNITKNSILKLTSKSSFIL